MTLTKKGSTRGSVSIIVIAALVFLATRALVGAIEGSTPASYPPIAWKPIPDVLKDEDDDDNKLMVAVKEKPLTKRREDGEQAPSATPASVSKKNKGRKRFALEKLFTDNVDRRPVLIFFTHKDSLLCKKVEMCIFANDEIRSMIESKFYPIKVSFDKKLTKTEYKIYERFGSAAAPMITIRSATGEALDHTTGYVGAIKTYVLLHNALRQLKRLQEQDAKE
ncbi:MAG: thioredoxin family protein [Candidatus Obscuribacterales bacterium]|nr:thioredoxin family protein [Candidatus Obscuribacterales bacterium]